MPRESVLARILAHKREELEHPRRLPSRRRRARHDFRQALARPGTRFIFECKRASPSAGTLRAGLSATQVVAAYRGIADAVSVLTDERFFGGSLDDLARIGKGLEIPLLRKDFILDPVQVREAWLYGADAVLLMLSVLDDSQWRACAHEAARLGLDVLTEVHNDVELERALSLDAAIIGINNRSFTDLGVDLAVTRRLAPRVPPGRILVCESGIHDRAGVRQLAPLVNAFLVGSAVMRAPRMDVAARVLASGEVKICGLTRPDDARAAWHSGASWGGLVFAAHSPRRLTFEQARSIARASPLPLVGVFEDAAPADVAETAAALDLAAVQLHGRETAHDIAVLRTRLPRHCQVWKAVRIRDTLPIVPENADRLIFDAAAPGNGISFDWSLLAARSSIAADGIAGGIRAGNVAAAIATGAGLLDVSSGVESAPGIKCAARMQELFDAIRTATRHREEYSHADA